MNRLTTKIHCNFVTEINGGLQWLKSMFSFFFEFTAWIKLWKIFEVIHELKNWGGYLRRFQLFCSWKKSLLSWMHYWDSPKVTPPQLLAHLPCQIFSHFYSSHKLKKINNIDFSHSNTNGGQEVLHKTAALKNIWRVTPCPPSLEFTLIGNMLIIWYIEYIMGCPLSLVMGLVTLGNAKRGHQPW